MRCLTTGAHLSSSIFLSSTLRLLLHRDQIARAAPRSPEPPQDCSRRHPVLAFTTVHACPRCCPCSPALPLVPLSALASSATRARRQCRAALCSPVLSPALAMCRLELARAVICACVRCLMLARATVRASQRSRPRSPVSLSCVLAHAHHALPSFASLVLDKEWAVARSRSQRRFFSYRTRKKKVDRPLLLDSEKSHRPHPMGIFLTRFNPIHLNS